FASAPTLFCLATPTAPSTLSSLSLHDALPISRVGRAHGLGLRRSRAQLREDDGAGIAHPRHRPGRRRPGGVTDVVTAPGPWARRDRKSTRLNSSHGSISYAVFCLKKKKQKQRH